MRLTLAASALASTFLIAGAAQAQQQQAPQALSNGLQRVQSPRIALAYVRPGTNWSKYKTILLQPVAVPAHVRNAAPQGATPQFGESYIISKSDMAKLESDFNKSFHQELTSAGFTFVDTAQADTLIVAPEIKNITLDAPTFNSRQTYGGNGFTVSRGGGGSITMGAVLADGATNTVIAEVLDRKYGSNNWQLNNRVTNFADAKEAFDAWADDLVHKLRSP